MQGKETGSLWGWWRGRIEKSDGIANGKAEEEVTGSIQRNGKVTGSIQRNGKVTGSIQRNGKVTGSIQGDGKVTGSIQGNGKAEVTGS
jgi:hypothetical protein